MRRHAVSLLVLLALAAAGAAAETIAFTGATIHPVSGPPKPAAIYLVPHCQEPLSFKDWEDFRPVQPDPLRC